MAIPRNTVNVSNNQINVVEVISFGPRGPQGPAGSGGGNIDEALTTASLAGYDLTFTKGDNSQFTLNLPQPTPTPTGQFIISASNLRSENVIDFERQNGTEFFVRVNNVENATSSSISVTANTASYVLASNIDTSATIAELTVTDLTASNINFSENLTVSGNVTAASFTGDLTWDNIIDRPYFLDTDGDITPNQIPIFIDTTTGLPENLPFSLPLGSEGGNPSVKGLDSLTFDGTTFNVSGTLKTNIVNIAQETGGAKNGLYFYDPDNLGSPDTGFVIDGGTYVELGYNNTSSFSVKDDTIRSTALQVRFDASNFRFDNLPTSDPFNAGQLFQTSSDAIGASAGFQVVLISQG